MLEFSLRDLSVKEIMDLRKCALKIKASLKYDLTWEFALYFALKKDSKNYEKNLKYLYENIDCSYDNFFRNAVVKTYEDMTNGKNNCVNCMCDTFAHH